MWIRFHSLWVPVPKSKLHEIMHMHLFGFSVGKVEVPAQPDFPQAYLNADQDV